MKAQFNQLLEDQKKRVKSLEQQVGQAKMSYAEALRNLEQISDEIHRVSDINRKFKILIYE
jgi:septation ring formation regulator EzrA